MGGPPSGPYPNYGDIPAEPSSAGYQPNNNRMYNPPYDMQQSNSQWTSEPRFQQPQWNYRDQEQGSIPGYFATVPTSGQPAQSQGQQQVPQTSRSTTPPLSENMTITPSPFKAAVQSNDTNEAREKIMEDASATRGRARAGWSWSATRGRVRAGWTWAELLSKSELLSLQGPTPSKP